MGSYHAMPLMCVCFACVHLAPTNFTVIMLDPCMSVAQT